MEFDDKQSAPDVSPREARSEVVDNGEAAHAQSAELNALTGKIDRVSWGGGHSLTAFAGDSRTNSTWTPGATGHAAAFTKGDPVGLEFEISLDGPAPAPLVSAEVRVSEGGAAVASGQASVGGSTVTGRVNATGFLGSTSFGQQLHRLEWEMSVDGESWAPLGASGDHQLYWLVGAPNGTLFTVGADKATGYAGLNGDPAAAIRSGIHGEVKYDEGDGNIEANPLSMFGGGGHVCADFANLLTALGNQAGLPSAPRIYYGGFSAAGAMVWVRAGTGGTTLTAVNPGNNDFTYHAVASVGGAIHDAALDRQGISADATFAGHRVRFVNLSTTAIPDARFRQDYDESIERGVDTVAVEHHAFGGLLDNGSFGAVRPITMPRGAADPLEVFVRWSISSGSLPPGILMDPQTGRLTGNPRRQGHFAFTLTVDGGGGISGQKALTMTVI